jgi:hypothetical protein
MRDTEKIRRGPKGDRMRIKEFWGASHLQESKQIHGVWNGAQLWLRLAFSRLRASPRPNLLRTDWDSSY